MRIIPQDITRHVINDPAVFTPRVWKMRETTIEKAASLWSDGYSSAPVGMHAPGVYDVYLPADSVKVDKKTGLITESYVVDTLTATCNCEGFEHMQGICKHLLAVQWRLAEYHNYMAPLYADALKKSSPLSYAPDPASAPVQPAFLHASPVCPKCSSSFLIPLDDFPGQSVCVSCNHISVPEEEVTPLSEIRRWPCPSPKSVIHARDFD